MYVGAVLKIKYFHMRTFVRYIFCVFMRKVLSVAVIEQIAHLISISIEHSINIKPYEDEKPKPALNDSAR